MRWWQFVWIAGLVVLLVETASGKGGRQRGHAGMALKVKVSVYTSVQRVRGQPVHCVKSR